MPPSNWELSVPDSVSEQESNKEPTININQRIWSLCQAGQVSLKSSQRPIDGQLWLSRDALRAWGGPERLGVETVVPVVPTRALGHIDFDDDDHFELPPIAELVR